MVTRKDFAREVSAKTGFTLKDIQTVLDAERAVLVEIIKRQDTVKAFDGITFDGTMVDARVGHNPQTGEPIEIPSRIKARAKFGAAFKRAINE